MRCLKCAGACAGLILLVIASAVPSFAQTVTATVPAGTSPLALAVNPATNMIYVPNQSSNDVTVINGTTNAVAATVPAGAGPCAVAVNPATNMIYVANQSSASVTVINGANNTVAATIPAGSTPCALAVNPVSNQIYVVNWSSNDVTVINGTTNTVAATVPVGTNPNAVAVNPVSNQIYVVNFSSNNVTVINGATNTVAATVVPPGSGSRAVAVNPVSNQIYVVNASSNSVTVINGATNTIVASVSTGMNPYDVAVNPVSNQIYVANYVGNDVTVIDGATNAVAATVPAGTSPDAVSVNPENNQVFVANYATSNVTVINGANNTVAATLSAGANPRAVGTNPVTSQVYVANYVGNDVTVINGATNSVATTISVGTSPLAAAANQVSNQMYVVNFNSASVSVIDEATNTVAATVAVGANPHDVVVNPATSMIYVTNSGGASVTAIDGATNTAAATIAIGSEPFAVAINPVTNQIYVPNFTNNVTVIDGGSNTVVATVQAGTHPYALAVNQTTNMVYVTNVLSNNVTAINGATNTVVATIPVGSTPQAVVVNPATTRIYVANSGDGTVTVIDGASNTVVATVSAGMYPFIAAVNPATNQIYVVNLGSNDVTVINGATNTVVATVPVGSSPDAVAVNPATNLIFVTNQASNNVTVIDGATSTAVATVPVGTYPYAVAVNPVTYEIYVANLNSNNVTVIAPSATQTIPLATMIAGVVDSQTVSQINVFQTRNPSPQFTVTVTSQFTSTTVYSSNSSAMNPPTSAVYYQVDGGTGIWKQAAMRTTYGANPAVFNVPLSGVPSGLHTLYVFAAYGREGTPQGSGGGTGTSPETGNITGYLYLVVPTPTTTTLASNLNPAAPGASVDFVVFVAEVAPGTALPTGTVTFSDGSTTLGTGTLDINGITHFSTSALTISSHAITATYAGDANNSVSASSVLTQQVLYSTISTVALTPVSSAYGSIVTMNATVSPVAPGTGTPTGTVTFLDGGSPIGTGTLDGTGAAAFFTSTLAAGAHSITAVYSGDSTNAGSTSSPVTETVLQVSQVISFTTLAPSSASLNSTFPVAAQSTSGLTVTLSVDSSSTSVCSLGAPSVAAGVTSAMATMLSATGTCTIDANQAGAGGFSPAAQQQTSAIATKIDAFTYVTSSLNASNYGQSVTLTATVAPVPPGTGTPSGGSLTFMEGTTVLGTGSPLTLSSLPGSAQAWSPITPSGTAPGSLCNLPILGDGQGDLIFYGQPACSGSNQLWVLSNANGLGGTPTWTQLSPTGGTPLGRHAAMSVYDPTTNSMIIFGGCLGGCFPTGNDVWVLSHANGKGGTPAWTQLSPATTPPARINSAVAYDPATNRLMIFGGQNGGGSACSTYSDTWVLTNANGTGGAPNWTQLSTTGGPPAGQYGPTTFYDSVDNRLTITGGSGIVGGSCSLTNAVWVLSNANGLGGIPVWTNLIAQGDPSAPANFGGVSTGVYDSANNRGLLQAQSPTNTVWGIINASGLGGPAAWANLNPSGGPALAGIYGVVFDSTNNLLSSLHGDNTVWVMGTGVDPITAIYSGDSNFNATGADAGSTATPLPQTVNQVSQTISFTTTAPSTAAYNSTFPVAAQSTSGLTVTLSVDAVSTGVCSLGTSSVAGGVTSATVTMLSASGICSIDANQSGNGNYSAAVQQQTSATAVLAGQTSSFTTTAPANAAYNSTFPIAAQSTSGLTVTLSVDAVSTGVCSLGTSSVAGGVTSATVTMLSASGVCTIDANQSGNGNYTAAAQQQTLAAAILASQALLTATGPASVTYGTTGTATATGGSGTGVVSFSAGASTGCSVTGTTVSVSNAAGTCSLTATKAADNNYSAATSAAFPVTLVKAAATLTLSNLSQTYNGTPKSATVTTNPNGLTGVSVTYTGTGGTTYGPTATAPTTAGSYTVDASLTNANYQASDTVGTLTVTAPTLVSIQMIPANPSILLGLTQQFTATGIYSDNSTQNITSSVSWVSGTPSVATIGANTGLATGVTAGTSQITATLGSVKSTVVTLTVDNPAPSIVNLSPLHSPAGTAFTLTVKGSGFVSTSNVSFNGKTEATTFSSGTQLMAAIPAADISSGGKVNVTVTNLAPGGSTSTASSFTIDDFGVAGPGSTVYVIPGQPTPVTISIAPTVNGFADAVQLGVSGLPKGTTAQFSQDPVTPGLATTKVTLTVTATAAAALPPVPTGKNFPGAPTGLLAAILAAGLLVVRRRMPWGALLPARAALALWLIVVGGLAASLGGCASLSGSVSNATPPGNYTITVTGMSGTAQHSSTVTLSIE